MAVACAQHPDGGPGALQVPPVHLGGECGPHLHVAPRLDVPRLGGAPHLVGLQPGGGDAPVRVFLRRDGDLPRVGVLGGGGGCVGLLLVIDYAGWPVLSHEGSWADLYFYMMMEICWYRYDLMDS